MIRKVNAVGALVENQHGEILVLLRDKNKAEGGTWGLVGGTIAKKESKTTALIREIKEEIGLAVRATDLNFVKTFTWKRPGITLIFGLFKTRFENSDKEFRLQLNEVVDYAWVKPEILYERSDLMLGLYDVLKTVYLPSKVTSSN